MAEVRKFKPGSSPIADAIAKAMGEPVRPVAPGSKPPEKKRASGAPRADIFSTTTQGFTMPAPGANEKKSGETE